MIPALSECAGSGLRAVGYNVLVAMEPVEDTTRGGLALPRSHVDKEQMVKVRARVVDIGPVAFGYDHFEEHQKPKIGDAVMIAKIAGVLVTGADGKPYRVIDDKQFVAIIDEAAFEGGQ